MQRWSGVFVLCLFVGMMLAPLAILMEFHIHRASIEKELCVQRDVVESMRTCHGECQLTKRFKALEKEAEAGFPMERIAVRYEPQMSMDERSASIMPIPADRVFPQLVEGPLSQIVAVDIPVPRG